MKKSFILFFIIILTASSCKKSGQTVIHIRKNVQIDYYLNNEANQLTENAVLYSFQKWQEMSGFKFIYKGRGRAGLIKDGKNTVSFLVKWPKDIPLNKIAWCQNWYDKSGYITESDIIFNMSITRFTTLKSNTRDSYYIEGVLCHEIGHMMGLSHIQSEKSIMKQKSNADESFYKGEIDNETIVEFKKLYSAE
jgi:predicted Zn-dependent protease